VFGGGGDDQLQVGRGRSVLIGSATAHDGDALALAAILGGWAASSSPARVAGLTGWLNASTVHDDGDEDELRGGSGQDWFLASLSARRRDRVSGAHRGEMITDISGW
jgi:Ca2+-binding RTX toxin-like protein